MSATTTTPSPQQRKQPKPGKRGKRPNPRKQARLDRATAAQFADEYSTTPMWPTPLQDNLGDGFLIGCDPGSRTRSTSAWLYRQVPLAAMADAKTTADLEAATEPVQKMFHGLAELPTSPVKNRRIAKTGYRQYHLLLANLPRPFRMPFGHPLETEFNSSLAGQIVYERVLLVGVRLLPQIDLSAGWQTIVKIGSQVFASEISPDAYAKDLRRVDRVLANAGLAAPSDRDLFAGDSWWSPAGQKDPQYLPHPDHVHIFDTNRSKERAGRYGFGHCEDWDPDQVPGHSALTFASLQATGFDTTAPTAAPARWMSRLLAAGARAVSVRGVVEPAAITLRELNRWRRQGNKDLADRATEDTMTSDRTGHQADLEDLEEMLSEWKPPTSLDTSVLAAFDGQYRDISHHVVTATGGTVDFQSMRDKQYKGLAEMRLCSLANHNPNLHEFSSWVLSHSGATNLARCGDRPGPNTALYGFTEIDRQPVWLSSEAHSVADEYPYLTVSASTRSGKTVMLQNLAYQWAAGHNRSGEHTPVVLVNLFEEKGDLSPLVHRAQRSYQAARTVKVDDITESDGFLDPFRIFQDKQEAVDFAVSQIGEINPWAGDSGAMERPLYQALSAGAKRGGRCVGEALRLAYEPNPANDDIPYGGRNLPAHMMSDLMELTAQNELMRCLIGVEPRGDDAGFQLEEGLTLVQCRSARIQLPAPGASTVELPQRVAMAFARALTFGLSMAMVHRQGVIVLDEAWFFTAAGRSELERLGRVASGQELLIVTASQKVIDTLDAGLDEFTSRSVLMHVKGEDDARAGLVLSELGKTPETVPEAKLARVRHPGKGEVDQAGRTAVAAGDTLKALIDDDRTVRRGAVSYHLDLQGRVAAVENVIPPDLISDISTNPEDIRRRQPDLNTSQLTPTPTSDDSDTPTGGGPSG